MQVSEHLCNFYFEKAPGTLRRWFSTRPFNAPEKNLKKNVLFNFFFFYFVLAYGWFKMFCQFHPNNKVIEYSFPSYVIREHWVEFPVIYSRSWLVVHFEHSTVYMSIPHSLTLSPALYPAVTESLFSKAVSLFLICK